MASKKAGRLAGLAALAGLAYMATRDKDKDKGAAKSDAKAVPADRDDSERVIGSRTPTPAKEVPFTGMPVSKSDVLPSYLGKQGSRPASVGGSPEIMDEYDDQSPAYKKNEFGEVYQAMREKDRKAYQDRKDRINANVNDPGYSAGMKKGGKVKKMASGGMTSSASKRADGIATKGKTRGRMC
jgi:hypothetical protein